MLCSQCCVSQSEVLIFEADSYLYIKDWINFKHSKLFLKLSVFQDIATILTIVNADIY